jgi:hypothetical protein
VGGSPVCNIIKAMNGLGMLFGQDRSVLKGIAYNGQSGNSGDGIQFKNNSCFMHSCIVAGMGGNGVWFGGPDAELGINCNGWYLEECGFNDNGQDGLYLSCRDIFSSANCNVGVAQRCFFNNNIRNGARIRDSGKNVFVGCLSEGNHAEGYYLLGMANMNAIIGGDAEANNSNTVQIRISSEEGGGHTPGDTVLLLPGLNSGTTLVDQGTNTITFGPVLGPGGAMAATFLPRGIGAVTRNARDDGGTYAGAPTINSGDAVHHALHDSAGERIRFGLVSNDGPFLGLLAAQVVANMTSQLFLCSRDVGSGTVEMRAGAGLVAYARLSNSANSFETNKNVNIVGGSVLKVAGTTVVLGQQPAVANATSTSDVVAQLNTLLARIRTHGLIAP